MKYGFLKVAAVSPDLKVADVKFNVANLKEEIAKYSAQGVEVLVFPELCLCGASCEDLFFQSFFIKECKKALKELVEFTRGISTLIFVGLPFEYNGKLYNCAAVLLNGDLVAIIPKTNLNAKEARYFVPADEEVEDIVNIDEYDPYFTCHRVIKDAVHDVCIGCEIGEDVFADMSPAVRYANAGAQVIVNLSASEELIGKAAMVENTIKAFSARKHCAYVMASAGAGETTSGCVYSGRNYIAENGKILQKTAPFSNNAAMIEIDVGFLAFEKRKKDKTSYADQDSASIYRLFVGEKDLAIRKYKKTPFIPEVSEQAERFELILSMQAQALAKRIKHSYSKTAVIGVSGGLDSTLALLVISRAFEILKKDKKDIVAITMPGFGTTGKTYNNALKMIEGVGCTTREINISESVLQHFKDIGHDKNQADVTYENAQARMRTLILMDVANQTNGLVVGTGDLSEIALGWCTYNGDHMSMYSVNSSIPKTLVKALVSYEANRLGSKLKSVLESVLGTEISPELLPPEQSGEIAQKTEDLVGPYELHDFYLYHIIRRGCCPKKVFALAKYVFGESYDEKTLHKWLKNFYKRFFVQQFKRSCAPDGVKIGSVGLSSKDEWKMPSDACASLWLEEVEKLL